MIILPPPVPVVVCVLPIFSFSRNPLRRFRFSYLCFHTRSIWFSHCFLQLQFKNWFKIRISVGFLVSPSSMLLDKIFGDWILILVSLQALSLCLPMSLKMPQMPSSNGARTSIFGGMVRTCKNTWSIVQGRYGALRIQASSENAASLALVPTCILLT